MKRHNTELTERVERLERETSALRVHLKKATTQARVRDAKIKQLKTLLEQKTRQPRNPVVEAAGDTTNKLRRYLNQDYSETCQHDAKRARLDESLNNPPSNQITVFWGTPSEGPVNPELGDESLTDEDKREAAQRRTRGFFAPTHTEQTTLKDAGLTPNLDETIARIRAVLEEAGLR